MGQNYRLDLKVHVITPIVIMALLLIPCIALAKYSSVTHFTSEKGFPGKFAYRLLQDKAGYIWISTENGMTRFNGYEFKLFTTNDGLPDNEILNFSEDDSSRLWFAPFSSTVGYIKKGRVYNSGNDQLLSRLHIETKAECILSDRFGNIVIAEKNKVTCISKEGKIREFYFKNKNGTLQFFGIFKTKSDDIYLADNSRNLYRYDHTRWNRVTQLPELPISFSSFAIEILGLKEGKLFLDQVQKYQLPFYYKHTETEKFNSMFLISKGILGIARSDGLFFVEASTSKIIDTLLYGSPVAIGMISADNSLWLCTHGHGVYRFINTPVKSLQLNADPSNVTCIKAKKEGMYAALERGQFVKAFCKSSGEVQIHEMKIPGYKWPDQIFRFLDQNKKHEWIGFNNRVCVFKDLDKEPVEISGQIAFKDIIEEDEQHLLVATSSDLLRFDKDKKLFTNPLFAKRSTCVAKLDHKIFAGTLDGLFSDDGKNTFGKILPGEKVLNTHIVKLCAGTDQVLWVANNKAELIAVKDKRIIAVINNKTGLGCHKILALKVSEKFVLVGTDNGLYALTNTPPYKIAGHLNTAMGLNSNTVNCIGVFNEKIWLGTTAGINYFDQDDLIIKLSKPQLIVNNITNDSITVVPSERARLLLKSLTIGFDVIDHSGGQKPLFQYRLNSDSNWTSIENPQLYFPEVPYGHFTIELRADSPNWPMHLYKKLQFYRAYPFYLRWWFIALVFVITGSITGLAVHWFIKSARKKDQEKAAVQRQLLQLEQMALQGQMNPHFIFNCIAAIKQFYSNGDNVKANIFVDKFASLIRQTFEMGTQIFVPADKEINYLNQYLSIEQTRFDDSFDFTINKETELPASSIYIPVMLLQPLAENAVRHGIRHLLDRRGVITAIIKQKGDLVTIIMSDNGVGREKSKAFGHFLQQNTPLTSSIVNAKRIELLDALFEKRILYRTEDIIGEEGQVAGTRTTISYPLSIYQIQN